MPSTLGELWAVVSYSGILSSRVQAIHTRRLLLHVLGSPIGVILCRCDFGLTLFAPDETSEVDFV